MPQCLLPTADSSAVSFNDTIPAWAKDSIYAVANAGIMTGLSDGTFGPSKAITRAEAVAALDKAVRKDAAKKKTQ